MTCIIIDGISGSGKSLLLQGLQQKVLSSQPSYSKLLLTEHLTERFFENTNPTPTQVHTHVARILRVAAELRAMHTESPFAAHDKVLTLVIERLFLTLMSRGLMNTGFFLEHKALCASLDLKSVLLVVPREQIKARIASSLALRNAGWSSFIASLGGMDAAAVHFEKQQEDMLRLNECLGDYMQIQVIEVTDTDMLASEALLESLLSPVAKPALT